MRVVYTGDRVADSAACCSQTGFMRSKGLAGGVGCGVGVGYGFGAGLMLRPAALESLQRSTESFIGAVPGVRLRCPRPHAPYIPETHVQHARTLGLQYASMCQSR